MMDQITILLEKIWIYLHLTIKVQMQIPSTII